MQSLPALTLISFMDTETALSILTRGAVEIISVELLQKKLETARQVSRPLVIKAGFDPTAPDMHLGHMVLLRKMRQFQDLGHKVVFLIGDFTAQVGDPTGRNELRKKMSRADVDINAATYRDQVFKVLDASRTEVVFNSRWLASLSAQEMMELSARSTVAQMLARADFKKRFEDGREISLLEFFYPLLQGYDSAYLKADVELGGTDQKFNLLMGRQIQESMGQPPQVVIMTPLLEGLDGVQKMSKSLGNCIGINEPPRDQFGKIMSISDEQMIRFYELLTEESLDVVRQKHPKIAKMDLAENLVGQFHGASAGREARENFERVFSQEQVPDDAQIFHLSQDGSCLLVDILVGAGAAPSKNEARRLIRQNAVTLSGVVLGEDWKPEVGVLKVGKRRFVRLI